MPLPIITVAQMREWEKATWASGQAELAVIERAGRAVARYAERITHPKDFILVFAGKGHNGDDAHQAAAQLAGREVHVLRVNDPEATLKSLPALLERSPTLLIDGLFGIGLSRPLTSHWSTLIQAMNNSGAPILAVDVPSGLNADTGEALEVAVRAAHTVTLGAVKQGLIKSAAWSFVGRLTVAPDIGLLPYPFTTEFNWIVPEDFEGFPPPRPTAGHKGTFGHLAIIAGSVGYHGASVLSARGAQRAQPGLISLFTADGCYTPVAAQLQSAMVHPWRDKVELPDSVTAIMAGPGLAAADVPDHVKETVRQLWIESPLAMLADASALGWLPEGACRQQALRVITPHPGEAARLLGSSSVKVLSERESSLRELSKRWGGAYVVLKGHQTLIGQAREDLFVNSSGNPLLGQGGSGDLLSGFLGGLLAQPALQNEAGRSLRYGVWLHGATADRLSAIKPNWTVEDLAAELGSK